MAKLADITSEIRVILKILGIALSAVIVIFLFVQGGQIAKNLLFPTPPAPPAEKFGNLPKVTFPGQPPNNLRYVINTLSGKLPQLSDRSIVYEVAQHPASLVALETVRNSLGGVGFSQNETKISESVYRWQDTTGATIQYNIVNNNFRITTNFLNDPPPTSLSSQAATKDGAYDVALSFLGSIGEDTKDLDPTAAVATYLKIENGGLVAAASQNDAQFIKISMFQLPFKDSKIYYSTFPESPMYFIFKSEGNSPKIVDASFFHYPAGQSSDYATKTSEDAFSDLKAGNAYVISQNPTQTEIDITDVTTGYYIGDDQPYFLPVVVFSGNGFTALVNALSSQ